MRRTLDEWDLGDVEEAATLAVSELVTNAVLHARSGPTLVLLMQGPRLRIEVHDQSPVLPARKHYGLDAGTGRGILLLEALVQAWGAEPTADGGKVVWFELEPGAAQDVAIGLDAETLADLESLGAGGVPPATRQPMSRRDSDGRRPTGPSARRGNRSWAAR